MKRKFLLLVMMCILMGGVNSLFAQTTIKIGNKTSTSNYFPARLRQAAVGDSYNYSSISQQIYTADEIKAAYGGSTPAGKISKIAFKSTKTNITTLDKTVKVYMKNVDIDVISAWDTSDDLKNNKVYEGSVSIDANGYLVFNLSPAFNYVEGKNILICVDNNRGESGVTVADVPFEIMGLSARQGAYTVSGTASTNYGFDGTWPTCSGRTQKNVIEITFSSDGAAVTPKFNNKQAYPFSDMPVTSNPYLKFYVENATHYQVTLSANEDLSNALYQTDWVATNGEKEIIIYKDFGLTYTPATKYYWKVVAKNGEGDDAPTAEAVYDFSTIAIPGEVTNVYPENDATDISNFITLTWDFAPNTEQYQVKIGSYTSEWLYTNGAEKGSFNVSEHIELEAGKTYTWSVNVKNAAGYPETITEYTFTTSSIYSVTDYTIKVAKADAGKNNVTLEWQYPDATATQYRINFATTNEVVAQGKWSDRIASTEMGGSYTMENVDFSETYYFRVDVRNENATANGDIVYCLVFDENKDWQATKYNNANDVYIRAGIYIPVERVDGNPTIARAKNVTIESDAYLKVAYQLIADNLTINDGGQLYNELKPNTYSGFNPIDAKSIKFNMNIVNPEGNWNDNDNKTGWQFIASPFQYTQITSFTENINGDYDLYKYTTKSVLWDNQKHENGIDPEFETEFVSGRGYLVSYEKDNNVTLTGTVNTGRNLDIKMYEYSNDDQLKNIYLIGNPFTFDMGWKDIKESAGGISDTYVVVNDMGGYEYKQDGSIKVGDGCLILATEAASIYSTAFPFYTPETNESARNIENNSLNIIATSKAGKDNVVVNFANERGSFPKLKNLNDEIAEIYVTNEGKRYGAYNYNTDIKEIELNFDAKEMGNYTISLDVNGEFETVTLVDRFTGIETNMLLEDEYNFTATSNDSHNRFVVRLTNGQQTTANSQFVYQSGEELILSIEGTVQIVDMLGRVVYSNEHANGNNRISVSEFNNAAYVVRVVNEEGVKSQKVVIY